GTAQRHHEVGTPERPDPVRPHRPAQRLVRRRASNVRHRLVPRKAIRDGLVLDPATAALIQIRARAPPPHPSQSRSAGIGTPAPTTGRPEGVSPPIPSPSRSPRAELPLSETAAPSWKS